MIKSKAVRALCVILALIFSGIAMTQTVASGWLIANLLWNTGDSGIKEVIMESAAEYYAGDIFESYLLSDSADKYSADNCNIEFKVIDADGKTVMASEGKRPTDFTFTFSKYVETDDYSEEPEYNTYSETVINEDYTRATDVSDSEIMKETEERTSAVSAEKHTFILRGSETDNAFDGKDFMYCYCGEPDDDILQYCKELYARGAEGTPYEEYGNYVVFYQSSFSVSTNGVPYFSENADEYLYIEDSDKNTDGEECTTQHSHPFTMEMYSVEIGVVSDMQSRDLFFYADKLADFITDFTDRAIPVTIICSVLALVLAVLTLVGAGFSKKDGKYVARGLHRIPYDIVLLLLICASAGDAVLFMLFCDSGIPMTAVFPVMLLLWIFYFFIETTLVRVRAGTLKNSFLSVAIAKRIAKLNRKAVHLGKRILRKLSDSFGVLSKLCIFYAVAGAFVLFLLLLTDGTNLPVGALVFVIGMLVLLAITALVAINTTAIIKGVKKLEDGNIDSKIEGRFLFGEFRKLARSINSIGDGMKKAVDDSLKSERMKTELITNVSHDIKTPLTSIINYTGLLKKCEIDDEKAVEYIDIIDRQSQRLKKLTCDIVDASRASTGNIEVHKEEFSLHVFLSQICGDYEERFEKASLVPVVNEPEEEIRIFSDSNLLRRAVDNLFSNALKYSMPSTRIYIQLSKNENFALLSVRNISATQLNIPADELTNRFVRGDESRNTEGSGLGLSIASSLASCLGGRLDISIDGDLFKAKLFIPIE